MFLKEEAFKGWLRIKYRDNRSEIYFALMDDINRYARAKKYIENTIYSFTKPEQIEDLFFKLKEDDNFYRLNNQNYANLMIALNEYYIFGEYCHFNKLVSLQGDGLLNKQKIIKEENKINNQSKNLNGTNVAENVQHINDNKKEKNMVLINKITEQLNSLMKEPKTIYVLKGFNSIYDSLKINIQKLDGLNLNEGYKKFFNIDKRLLNQEINRNLLTGKAFYCFYEDLYFIESLKIIGSIEINEYKVVIIDIGLFENAYPGFYCDNLSYYTNLFDEDTPNYNELQLLYSKFTNENGNVVIDYNLLDNDDLYEHVNLFNVSSKDYYKYNFDKINSVEILDNYNTEKLVRAFNEIIFSKCNTIIYKSFENRNSDFVNKFITTFNKLGINVCLETEKIKQDKPKLYNDYLEILHRRNSNWDFVDINMYDDPFNSKEIKPVNQSVIIDTIYSNIVRAKNRQSFRDVFVTAPTGAGKSVLFQIPAIYAAEKNNLVTIVVSPLIGLMNDQVSNIVDMTKCAATINSEFTPYEKDQIKDNIKNGKISILYISPETLLSNADITTLIGERDIGLLVIDEAHTVATWGKNFRPDYWYLGDFLNNLRHKSKYVFPIATFTATATISDGHDDMYHDIIDSLNMTPIAFIGDVKRRDIKFDINVKKKDIAYAEEKLAVVDNSIDKFIKSKDKTLVYFPYVKQLESFKEKYPNQNVGIYHGRVDKFEKNETLNDLKLGDKNVVFATKAFGMGIDIKDISNVYHFAPTGNLADYVQEIGRVARKPGMIGHAITDYFREDFRYINKLYGMSQITNSDIIGVLNKILYTYKKEHRRNFLMSTEEFSHVFNAQSDADIENKLKATFLAIKKDFVHTTSYVPIIFKPRSMYSEGYFYIPDVQMDYIRRAKYDRYLTLEYDRNFLQKTDIEGKHRTYYGDVYKFNFKQCWEERFNDKDKGRSFGQFKHDFYDVDEKTGLNKLKMDKSAFCDRTILTVECRNNTIFNDVCNRAYVVLTNIKNALDDIKISNKHFTIQELAEKACSKFRNGYNIKKMKNLLGPFINMIINVKRNSSFSNYNCIQYNTQTDKYHIVSQAYDGIIRNIINAIKVHFADFLNESKRICIVDTTKNKDKKMRSDILLVAVQMLELFELVNYEFKSGDRPEFFIRVNSELAITKILNNPYYCSETLKNIQAMHYDSVKYMTYFFECLNTDKERWDFIESYFLGHLNEDYDMSAIEVKINNSAIKKLDEEIKSANNLNRINKLVKLYYVYSEEDDVTDVYYVDTLDIPYFQQYPTVSRVSPESEIGKHLLKAQTDNTFKIDNFAYTVERIETINL